MKILGSEILEFGIRLECRQLTSNYGASKVVT